MTAKTPPATKNLPSTLEKMQRISNDGQTILGLLLDVESVRCLASGSVNSRAEVEAQRRIAEYDAGLVPHTRKASA